MLRLLIITIGITLMIILSCIFIKLKVQRPELPLGGELISVETALNSRCSSDVDNNPKIFHWGMFESWGRLDRLIKRRLTPEHISMILKATNIPRFTDRKIAVYNDNHKLIFTVDARAEGIEREWLWIESGMQQQAVYLICSALGIGVCARGDLGENGALLNPRELGTIHMKLGVMKPSFEGSYWSSSEPKGENSWVAGNLPDPDRKGKVPLVSIIDNLKTQDEGSNNVTKKAIGQLLWAARGRTPHYYKSKPWGMTIPTWTGLQETTTVYLISEQGIFKYVNWKDNHPTSSIDKINDNSISSINKAIEIKKDIPFCIVIGINENTGKAFWEVGYQLENIILQATSLNITFRALLLTEKQRQVISELGIANPVVIVTIGQK